MARLGLQSLVTLVKEHTVVTADNVMVFLCSVVTGGIILFFTQNLFLAYMSNM